MFTLLAVAIIIWAFLHISRNRAKEEKQNERFERVPARQLSWHIAHMRDDVGGIAILLVGILIMLGIIADRIGS